MLRQQVYSILLAFLLHSGALEAKEPQSFLSDTLVRKDQVQNVLEHQPAKEPHCQQVVRQLCVDVRVWHLADGSVISLQGR